VADACHGENGLLRRKDRGDALLGRTECAPPTRPDAFLDERLRPAPRCGALESRNATLRARTIRAGLLDGLRPAETSAGRDHRFFDERSTWRKPERAPRSLEPSYFEAVASAVRRRGWRDERLDDAWLDRKKRAGRLLVYLPDCELSDAAAEGETEGFFDVFNCPPWETWVGFFRDDGADASSASYLVAWIPVGLVAKVQRGIDVNPERCIEWLSDAGVGLEKDAPWLLEFHP
jgi:hypothetical protein